MLKKQLIFRRIIQSTCFVLFVYILWATTYPLKSALPPELFFKINPLVMIFTSLSARTAISGMLWIILPLILTLILGRFFCGWICPLGAFFDFLNFLNISKYFKYFKFSNILKFLHIAKPSNTSNYSKISANYIKNTGTKKHLSPNLRFLKFFILILLAVFALLGIQLVWIFDPLVITNRFISLNAIPAITESINKTFIFLLQKSNFYSPLYDFYRTLKSSFLSINPYFFVNSGIILIFFVAICLPVFFVSRFWCRIICPLGALYALVARFSFLERTHNCVANCGLCTAKCRMGAINQDLTYRKEECILCLDCVAECPQKRTNFIFFPAKKNKHNSTEQASGITRRNTLFLLFSSLLFSGCLKKETLINKKESSLLRPPGVVDESTFTNLCIRCGNCMKVCITNGLQPAILDSGLAGIWTPKLIPEIGYCEYNCNLCGQICPTYAIPKLALPEKQQRKLGLAKVDRSICFAWENKLECIVCEEQCPIPTKAIKIIEEKVDGRIIPLPVVDPNLCIGCGACQNKCPVRPMRAIKVYKLKN